MLRRATVPVVALLLAVGAACGSDASTSTDDTSTPSVQPVEILLTNDDGIGAPGIDVMASALQALPDVRVVVVAPADDQTDTSDQTTDDELTWDDATTASGIEGTAVDGYPADAVLVAFEELGVEPNLVVSGVNEGHAVGPQVFASGAVGAARTATRDGVPSVVASAGAGDGEAELAASLVVDWITANRDDLAGATDGQVVNINVPSCTAGTAKDLVEVDLATETSDDVDPSQSDCSVEVSETPADDVSALANGYPTLTLVPTSAPYG
jgi:5'-nucleotidase